MDTQMSGYISNNTPLTTPCIKRKSVETLYAVDAYNELVYFKPTKKLESPALPYKKTATLNFDNRDEGHKAGARIEVNDLTVST